MLFAKTALSPYWDLHFFEIFAQIGQRLLLLFQGGGILAADEIQILVLGCISISCGVLGPVLVLKKMTMLANSLAHTILLGLAISFLISRSMFSSTGFDMPHLLFGALIAALLTVFSTYVLTRLFRLQEDASIGLVFTALFALGIVVVTLFTRDVHLSVEVVMGNADALRFEDLVVAADLALMNGLFVLLFFWPLQMSSFDSGQSMMMGNRLNLLQPLLLFLTAASCIGAFRAVGVLLVLSFLVGPFLIARLFFHRLWHLLIVTPAIGIFASLIGVALARHLLSVYGLALSTGGIVSTLIALLYPAARIVSKFSRLKELKSN
ncbi:MAG: ABC-type transporter, permease subunit [Parachlamydiales bacterium]|nr:ABC-type transporter, permease subunit [Parachlamydiales bacterium]